MSDEAAKRLGRFSLSGKQWCDVKTLSLIDYVFDCLGSKPEGIGMKDILEMLFVDRPLVVNPQLAAKIGLNEAIILQQIKYWIDRTEFKYAGRKCFFKTVDDWELEFPFWSKPTIRRILKSLEQSEFILSKKLHGHFFKEQSNQTLWYSLNTTLIPFDQNAQLEITKSTNGKSNADNIVVGHNVVDVPNMGISSSSNRSIPNTHTENILTHDQFDQLSTETTPKTTAENTDSLSSHFFHPRSKSLSGAAIQTPEGKKWGTEDDVQTVNWMYLKILAVNPSARKPDLIGWANDIRLMRQALNITHCDIHDRFRFANSHHFWSENVQSPRALRKQWDRLAAQQNTRLHTNRNEPNFDDISWADNLDWGM